MEKKYPKGTFNSTILTVTIEGDFFYKLSVETDRFTYNMELDKAGKTIKTDKIVKESPQPVKNSSSEGGVDRD
jgi:hypothetical protein